MSKKTSGTMRVGVLAERGSRIFSWHKTQALLNDSRAGIIYLEEVPDKRPFPKFSVWPARLAWRIIQKIEERLCGFVASRFEPSMPVELQCHMNGHFKDFPSSQIELLRNLNLDVIIRLGGHGIYRGEILDVAKNGILSVHHGNPSKFRGGPPGFWEIIKQTEEVGFIVQRLTPELDAGMILSSGSIPNKGNAALNVRSLYEESDKALAQTVEYLISHKMLPAAQQLHQKGPIYKMPTLLDLLIYVLKHRNAKRFKANAINA